MKLYYRHCDMPGPCACVRATKSGVFDPLPTRKGRGGGGEV